MIKRTVLFIIGVSLALGGIGWSAGQPVQPATAAERKIMDTYRQKAERVQEIRKARITQEQRQAAAERTELKRPKPTTKGTPAKPGKKGGTQ
jgi:hypothetical protein